MITHFQHWVLADDPFMVNDDASPQASLNSFKCSSFQFLDPGQEDEHAPTDATERTKKCTPLSYRTEEPEPNYTKPFNYCPPRMDSCSCGCSRFGSSHAYPRLTRIRSCPHERRSQQQLLQRSMMLEEMYKYKRRFFNNVGAVENLVSRWWSIIMQCKLKNLRVS